MKKTISLALALLLTFGMTVPQTVLATIEVSKVNWSNENGTYYALNESNERIKGWIKDEFECWYFLDYKSAAMKKGWVAGDATHWYYLNPSNGIMQTGWKTIDGKQFYFETKGKLAGAMVTGTKDIEGRKYNFDSNGTLVGESIKGEPLWSDYENVDKKTKEILAEIIKPGMSEHEELRAIHDWVALNTTYGGPSYSRDKLEEMRGEYIGKTGTFMNDRYVKTGPFYLDVIASYTSGYGVCDEYARVVSTLADALGYRTTVIGGQTKDGGHQVAAIWMNDEWKIIDAQIDDSVPGKILDLGFLVSYDEQEYFTVSSDWISLKNKLTYSAQIDAHHGYDTNYIRYNQ